MSANVKLYLLCFVFELCLGTECKCDKDLNPGVYFENGMYVVKRELGRTIMDGLAFIERNDAVNHSQNLLKDFIEKIKSNRRTTGEGIDFQFLNLSDADKEKTFEEFGIGVSLKSNNQAGFTVQRSFYDAEGFRSNKNKKIPLEASALSARIASDNLLLDNIVIDIGYYPKFKRQKTNELEKFNYPDRASTILSYYGIDDSDAKELKIVKGYVPKIERYNFKESQKYKVQEHDFWWNHCFLNNKPKKEEEKTGTESSNEVSGVNCEFDKGRQIKQWRKGYEFKERAKDITKRKCSCHYWTTYKYVRYDQNVNKWLVNTCNENWGSRSVFDTQEEAARASYERIKILGVRQYFPQWMQKYSFEEYDNYEIPPCMMRDQSIYSPVKPFNYVSFSPKTGKFNARWYNDGSVEKIGAFKTNNDARNALHKYNDLRREKPEPPKYKHVYYTFLGGEWKCQPRYNFNYFVPEAKPFQCNAVGNLEEAARISFQKIKGNGIENYFRIGSPNWDLNDILDYKNGEIPPCMLRKFSRNFVLTSCSFNYVSLEPQSGNFNARLYHYGNIYFIGRFDSEYDAEKSIEKFRKEKNLSQKQAKIIDCPGTSKYKHTYWSKSDRNWKSKVHIPGGTRNMQEEKTQTNHKYVGTFNTQEEAARASLLKIKEIGIEKIFPSWIKKYDFTMYDVGELPPFMLRQISLSKHYSFDYISFSPITGKFNARWYNRSRANYIAAFDTKMKSEQGVKEYHGKREKLNRIKNQNLIMQRKMCEKSIQEECERKTRKQNKVHLNTDPELTSKKLHNNIAISERVKIVKTNAKKAGENVQFVQTAEKTNTSMKMEKILKNYRGAKDLGVKKYYEASTKVDSFTSKNLKLHAKSTQKCEINSKSSLNTEKADELSFESVKTNKSSTRSVYKVFSFSQASSRKISNVKAKKIQNKAQRKLISNHVIQLKKLEQDTYRWWVYKKATKLQAKQAVSANPLTTFHLYDEARDLIEHDILIVIKGWGFYKATYENVILHEVDEVGEKIIIHALHGSEKGHKIELSPKTNFIQVAYNFEERELSEKLEKRKHEIKKIKENTEMDLLRLCMQKSRDTFCQGKLKEWRRISQNHDYKNNNLSLNEQLFHAQNWIQKTNELRNSTREKITGPSITYSNTKNSALLDEILWLEIKAQSFGSMFASYVSESSKSAHEQKSTRGHSKYLNEILSIYNTGIEEKHVEKQEKRKRSQEVVDKLNLYELISDSAKAQIFYDEAAGFEFQELTNFSNWFDIDENDMKKIYKNVKNYVKSLENNHIPKCKVKVAKSETAGVGVFATNKINQYEVIGIWSGDLYGVDDLYLFQHGGAKASRNAYVVELNKNNPLILDPRGAHGFPNDCRNPKNFQNAMGTLNDEEIEKFNLGWLEFTYRGVPYMAEIALQKIIPGKTKAIELHTYYGSEYISALLEDGEKDKENRLNIIKNRKSGIKKFFKMEYQ